MDTPDRSTLDPVVVDTVRSQNLFAQGERGQLEAKLFTPLATPKSARGLIVFFPPGGFIKVELEGVAPFARRVVASTGYAVLASAYTVSGIRPFPSAVEDAHALLDWVCKQHSKLGWDGKHLVVAGLEAGGNLAAVSALMARDRGWPRLTAQILIMPMLDPGLTSCSMRTVTDHDGATKAANECAAGYRGYLPRAVDRTHPYASPLQTSRLKGLPPALVISADDDPLRDEAEQYGDKLLTAGIRTTVRRLPPIELDAPSARCSSVRKESVLKEISTFIAGLNATNI